MKRVRMDSEMEDCEDFSEEIKGLEAESPRAKIAARRSLVFSSSGFNAGKVESAAAVASSPKVNRITYSDRFIPSRSSSNLTGFALLDKSPSSNVSNVSHGSETREDSAAAYSMLLRTELFGSDPGGPMVPSTPEKLLGGSSRDSARTPMSPTRNLFRFKNEHRGGAGACASPESPFSLSPVGLDVALAGTVTSPRKAPRKIARSPYKVLDAPALQDDFYLNLVDWSSLNVLAVGLGPCVYLWSACTSKVTKLCDLSPNDGVCSVGWTQRGTYLAVGTNLGEVQIWDATRCKKVRTMGGHRTRVGTLAWSSNVLSSGSRDRNILQRDIRAPEDFVNRLVGHKSEVCGLKWSYDDRELASGGNDNQLFVWNQLSTQPVLKFSEHTAAVKAIAWSPHQHGLLASGGGTADRCIRFWNTGTSTHLSCVDTGSQVCNLVWSKNVNELVSTHGYSQNQIIVWRYPAMSKLSTLTGHSYRVLYLAISPDGQTIVTGAGDETLRFWNVFPCPKSQQSAVRNTGIWSLGRTHIR
ncbi:protein FIZZY-RELATED 2 isoform X1 [Selaginella moellendorffii]|uniref:protein FIZZY-RELATED 2 isoform X1 n=1 Tax=Selaginella moellendorffii TaxID=88036 RepID=UPI000D1CE231|nr:protein FIZZY-RELATED 2 isoform X1 [Selaginella moellendorffii]|eukprot:XP_024518977.1 protein FIZZY-RELATED 2 isoform X1 [Selaginella moellendorffii]